MGQQGNGKRQKNYRFAVLGAAFLVSCIAFVIVLAAVQIKGPSGDHSDRDLTVRTETVSGVRGRIYDRNGVLLVDNSTSYDLAFEYGAMPDTMDEMNASLLACLSALEQTGNADKRTEDHFPLVGAYPDLSFSPELADEESDIYFYYSRFLTKQAMDPEITAEELVAYFTEKYNLTEDKYSAEQILELMKLRYEMLRVGFGAYQSYTIAENVDMALITRVEEQRIEGATLVKQTEREYLYPGVASHILGRLGKITADNSDYYCGVLGYSVDSMVGISGCEEAFEEYLHGSDGVKVSKYDKDGNLVEEYYDPAPVIGKDVYLTIDIELQIAAEEGLAEAADRIEKADAGALTALDANSGKILAIASYPTYDLSLFDSAEYYNSLLENEDLPLYNRALQGVYAPGSTYKIGASLAALESGHITGSSAFVCNKVYPHLHGPTCLGNHGSIGVSEAIRVSCNVFFYYLGHEMGISSITEYTKQLGLGVSTGIELGERVGIVAGPEYREENNLTAWDSGDDLSAAIGQSDHGYTPLQLSVYMSTIVNGGTRYAAHLLDSVYTQSGELCFASKTDIMNTVDFSESTRKILVDAMGEVVSSSDILSSTFKNVTVSVGGKTGTAQVAGADADYALFSGFAPLDKPEIVVSCILEEGVAGQNAAIPVAKVLEAYFGE